MKKQTAEKLIDIIIESSDYKDFTHLLADYVIDRFDRENKEGNFITQDFVDSYTDRRFNLTIQLADRTTPPERLSELKDEVENLKKQLHRRDVFIKGHVEKWEGVDFIDPSIQTLKRALNKESK